STKRRPGSETLAMGLGPSRNRTPAGLLSLSSTPGAAGMWTVFLLVMQLAGHPGPGPETLPRATVLVDSGAHQLVIKLPPVDVPGAGRGSEAMVGLPL